MTLIYIIYMTLYLYLSKNFKKMSEKWDGLKAPRRTCMAWTLEQKFLGSGNLMGGPFGHPNVFLSWKCEIWVSSDLAWWANSKTVETGGSKSTYFLKIKIDPHLYYPNDTLFIPVKIFKENVWKTGRPKNPWKDMHSLNLRTKISWLRKFKGGTLWSPEYFLSWKCEIWVSSDLAWWADSKTVENLALACL